MRASLVFDDRGVGHTPDGEWLYYPGPPTKEVLPAGHAAERVKWMSLGFVEEGENAREMLPSTSDEESEGEGEGEKGEDVEMGGMGRGARRDEEGDGGEGGKGVEMRWLEGRGVWRDWRCRAWLCNEAAWGSANQGHVRNFERGLFTNAKPHVTVSHQQSIQHKQ